MSQRKPYNSNFHNVYSIKYHIVFCPKYRRPVLIDGVDTVLKQMIPEILAEKEIKVIEMEVMPDHVRLLVDCPLTEAPADIVSAIKRKTSHVIRRDFAFVRSRIPTLWTRGSFIASVGAVSLDTVKQYILDQKAV